MIDLSDYPDEYLECRTAHAWKTSGWWLEQNRPRIYRKTYLCERCNMIRIDKADRNFNINTRRYIPPPKYKIEGGRVYRHTIIAAQITKDMVKNNE
ncbi:MAG: hypothetical protein LC778_10390 [Acidobacteria bacterium]|nr:hypothetical protein [Acidobacteriota bacterium]